MNDAHGNIAECRRHMATASRHVAATLSNVAMSIIHTPLAPLGRTVTVHMPRVYEAAGSQELAKTTYVLTSYGTIRAH